FFLALKSSSFL
ncbi:hypothetical protein MPH_14214, partial [Macrophomina phaseolina MS6]